jgi:hypothetical protein
VCGLIKVMVGKERKRRRKAIDGRGINGRLIFIGML